MDLEVFFTRHPKSAIALSGGVDSALLVWAAGRYGRDCRAYFVRSVFQPSFEERDAREIARQCGVPLTILEADVLAMTRIAANPPDRCYHCKRCLFTALRQRAAADGYSLLLDGTNASDDAEDRPGMRALRELAVRSPLRECGLTKEDVRRLARAAGLPVWDKPAYACLATRVPAGTPLTRETLARIETGEALLEQLGLRDFRLRLRNGAALLQVTAAQVELARALWPRVVSGLSPLFPSVKLDPVPRTPSR